MKKVLFRTNYPDDLAHESTGRSRLGESQPAAVISFLATKKAYGTNALVAPRVTAASPHK
jgi:hypothetical protein